MVMAAVRGVIDFREARFFDPAWRRRVQLLLSGLQDLLHLEELKTDHEYFMGLLANQRLKPELLGDVVKQVTAIRERMDVAYRPWITPENREEAKAQEAKKLQNIWETMYGKLDDPETQRRIARQAAAMRAQRELNAAEISADDILTDRKKRAVARDRVGQPRRTRKDAIGRNLQLSRKLGG